MVLDTTIEEIDKKIARLRLRKKMLQVGFEEIRAVHNVPIEEKLQGFDKLYKLAQEILEHWVKNRNEDNDYDQWAFEAVIELLGEKDKIWKLWNSIYEDDDW